MKTLSFVRLLSVSLILVASFNAPAALAYPNDRPMPPANHPGYSEGLDLAMEVCNGLQQPHLRSKCRNSVGRTYFILPSATAVCKSLDFAPSVVECIEVIANRNYRESEIRSCSMEEVERDRVNCLKSLRDQVSTSHGNRRGGTDLISKSHVRAQIRGAVDMMDLGNFFLARSILGSLLIQLEDDRSGVRVRPGFQD